jgi:glycosyltransferase involved in cell wall biosynthesis
MHNILFLHSSSELYGSDRSLLTIVSNIDKNIFNVYVVLPCEGPLVEEIKKIHGVKLSIYELAVLRRKNFSFNGIKEFLGNFISSYIYICKYIKINKIDTVYTNSAAVLPGAVAATRMKTQSIWHVREIYKNKIENKIVSFFLKNFSNKVIVNSKSTGKSINIESRKITVIYNSVESKIASNKHKMNEIIKIGMAGRINRWKGQKLFVDCALQILKVYQNVEFHIAGEAYQGEEFLRNNLVEYINEKNLSDKVILLGQVDDMTSFYDSLNIFVLPSIQPEPFGLVVIEAMSHKLPVIATNHGGPTEIVEDGITGYLVDFNNPNQMASRIIQLIENYELRITMGQNGYEKKLKCFSTDSMIKSIECTIINNQSN